MAQSILRTHMVSGSKVSPISGAQFTIFENVRSRSTQYITRYVPSDVPRHVSRLHRGPPLVHMQGFGQCAELGFVREELARHQQPGVRQVLKKLEPEAFGRLWQRGVGTAIGHHHHRTSRIRVAEIVPYW